MKYPEVVITPCENGWIIYSPEDTRVVELKDGCETDSEINLIYAITEVLCLERGRRKLSPHWEINEVRDEW